MIRRAGVPLAVLSLLCIFVLVLGGPLIAQGSLPQVVDVTSSTAGQITADAPTARFVVVAPANGGSADIQVSSIGPGFAPHFHVLDPTGTVVIEVANTGSQNTVSGAAPFSAPGAYVIEVSGEQGSTGQFVLTLRAGVAPPTPVDLTPELPVSGIVGSQTPVLIYRFAWAGLAGQTLTITGTSPDLGPAYSISDEATGHVIAMSNGTLEGGSHVLTGSSKVYRVEIHAISGKGDTPFTICLACGGSAALTVNATLAELPIATAVPTETQPPAPTTPPCMIVSSIAGMVNIRKGPSTSYGIVGALRKGESYPAVAQTSGWYELDYNGGDGWVSVGGTHLEGDCGALPMISGGAAPAQNAAGQPDIAFKSRPSIVTNTSKNLTTVAIEIINASNTAAGPSSGSLCVASACQTFAIAALGPSGNTVVIVNVAYNTQPMPVKIVLDSGNQVAESSESNNVFQGTITPYVAGSDEPQAQANNPPPAAQAPANNPPAPTQAQANNPPAPTKAQANKPPAPSPTEQQVIQPSPTEQQVIQPSPTTQQLIGPDLWVSVGIMMDPNLNQDVLGVIVLNKGDTAAGPTTLTVCAVSTCHDYAVGPLAPGGVSQNFTGFLAYGDQPVSVLVQADSGNAVSELDEGNNYFEQSVTPQQP